MAASSSNLAYEGRKAPSALTNTRGFLYSVKLTGKLDAKVRSLSTQNSSRGFVSTVNCKEAGKLGGNPNLVPTLKWGVKGGVKGGVNPSANPKPTPSSSSSSSILVASKWGFVKNNLA